MRKTWWVVLCAGLLIFAAGEAAAQRSLFNEAPAQEGPPPAASPPPSAPPAPAPSPAPAASPPVAAEPQPKAKPRPRKPRGPVPARALTVQNATANTLTSLEVSAEGKSAKLARPLRPKGRTSLRLPAFKSCAVTVAAAFENVGQTEPSEFDICKDKLIRFTE